MARTTVADVLRTFDAEVDDPAVEQWIRQASYVVDDVASARPHLEADRLADIETLVAQHFLAAQQPRFESQEGGSRSASFGEGRSGTSYLDRAKRLDPTGQVADSLEQDDIIING